MLRVYACVSGQHELRLVAVALLVCLLGSYTALGMLRRAQAAQGAWRNHWLGAAAVVFAAGVWATHFVAMLAYQAGYPVGYDVVLTALSVAAAIALSLPGFVLAVQHRAVLAGGAILGLAIGSMHYIGMEALIVPADLHWDESFLAASLLVGAVGSAMAMRMFAAGPGAGQRIGSAVLLTAAIIGLHFTAMAGLELQPDPLVAGPTAVMPSGWPAVAVVAVTGLILGLGLLGAVVDQHLAFRDDQADRLRANVADLERTKQALEATTRDLEHALELASSGNRAKSQFLAIMSHELRTPLNAILGFSEMLAGEMFGAIGDKRYVDHAKIIHDSGRHLLSVITGILDFSQLDAGQMTLREADVDVRDAIDSTLKLIGWQATDAGVTLDQHVAADLPLLHADPHRLRQILINLVSNAVKFTPCGGNVRVTAARRGADMAVTVADTGIGIAAEDIPKALEPFRQIDNTLSRKYEGTGLGLPLAKRLTEMLDGTLEIVSSVGGGTTVILTFPGARCRKPEAAPAGIELAAAQSG